MHFSGKETLGCYRIYLRRRLNGDAGFRLRRGNVIAVAQAKCGKQASGLHGIEQLALFSGQPYGSFTHKLLLTDDRDICDLHRAVLTALGGEYEC